MCYLVINSIVEIAAEIQSIKNISASIPEKSDLSRFTPLVIVFTIPLCRVLAPPE
jgi:hypothetical protein